MALNLEQSSGITAVFGSSGFATSGAANAQVSTATAITLSTAGVASNFAVRASAVYASTNDARTGVAPPAILGGQAAVVVAGVSGGVLTFTQGPITTYPMTGTAGVAAVGAGDVALQLPSIPDGFVPVAYQVIKNKNLTGTAGWTYGASLFNAANVSFETPVQVTQLPNKAIPNASA